MTRVTRSPCGVPSLKPLVVMLKLFTEKSTEKGLMDSIMDIEDLVKNGSKHR